MARFRLVKIGKKKVEVRKVGLKVNLTALFLSFLFAVLIWLYLTGRDASVKPEQSEDSQPEKTQTAEHVTKSLSEEFCYALSPVLLDLNGGSCCES